MRKIEPIDISNTTISALDKLQSSVNSGKSFDDRKDKAKSLWLSKKSTQEAAFTEIENNLKTATLPNGICHYCEWNEASEIEHILPKTYFPEQAFIWDNYLYVCGKCNREKLAHFCIFDPAGSDNVHQLPNPVKGSPATQPPTTDICFIQSRLDNPMDYLILDFKTLRFVELAKLDEATCLSKKRDRAKAEQTLSILDLNRAVLEPTRRNSLSNYKMHLEWASKIVKARETRTLANISNVFQSCLTLPNFLERKKACLDLVKSAIQKHTFGHPTVWKEMKRQRTFYPDLNQWFTDCPDALNW